MKKSFRGALAALLLTGSLTTVWSQNTEDSRLNEFFGNYLDAHFQLQPLEATQLGDHRFDARLDDISPAARARWRALAKSTLKALPGTVDYRQLSRDGQIDYEIFQHELQRQLWLADHTHPFAEDPRTYGSYLNDSVYLLVAQSTLPKETNVANAIARMAQMPRIIATAKNSLTHPARPILETAIRQNAGAITFYETDLFHYVGETAQQAALKAAAAKVVSALQDYQAFLEGPARARAEDNWRLGKAKFAKKFELEVNAGLTAEQNLADARSEFDRVRTELYIIARQLWPQYFPRENLPADDDTGRRATILRVIDAVNQEHGEAGALVADARATVERIKSFIRDRDYLRLPEPDRCAVIEMPEFRRGNSLAYLDNAPPLDPDARSYYAVSPPPADWTAPQVRSFLEEYNRWMLQILTIHEAYPGHYVQLEYANRNPSIIRRVLQSGTYIEGWAVYGEVSMLNAGYGGGDLRLRLMQLKFYLRAVANSILDYRMHCTQMSDAEAMKFLTEDAFQSEGEAKLKVIRAKQSSVQLSTYFVGRMAHYRLRQQMQRELGDKFDLARYHEAVLETASVPTKYLPELVHRRLAEAH
ncbi:MAG TPA: DUF885 domain-containing protein [Verrucomicrobiae bacterium]|nr:DUF885 domain-containing protein [Verrucomicrobiae bacterium]